MKTETKTKNLRVRIEPWALHLWEGAHYKKEKRAQTHSHKSLFSEKQKTLFHTKMTHS